MMYSESVLKLDTFLFLVVIVTTKVKLTIIKATKTTIISISILLNDNFSSLFNLGFFILSHPINELYHI